MVHPRVVELPRVVGALFFSSWFSFLAGPTGGPQSCTSSLGHSVIFLWLRLPFLSASHVQPPSYLQDTYKIRFWE